MSIVTFRCDECGLEHPDVWINSGNRIKQARLDAEQDGWQCHHNERKDYCPSCVKSGKAPKRKESK